MTQPIAEILTELEQAIEKTTGEALALYMDDCIVAEAEVEDENAAIIARFFDDEEGANAKFFVMAKNRLPSLLAEVKRLQAINEKAVAALKSAKDYLLHSSKSVENRAVRTYIQQVLMDACTVDHSKIDACSECGYFTIEENA